MVSLKAPNPEPIIKLLFANVGFCVVDQQTPRAVTGAPPSLVAFPPTIAELKVIFVAFMVVRVGKAAPVTKVS